MPNELERIQIKGYKSIRELDLELRALNVLIGANGSGKSNFISIFRLLNEILEENLQRFSGATQIDNLLYFGQKVTTSIDIDIKFVGEMDYFANGYMVSLIPSSIGTLIFSNESYSFHNRDKYLQPRTYFIGSGHSETRLHSISKQADYRRVIDYVIKALSSWKLYHFHDTSASSPLKRAQNINENERLKPDASNIAAYLYLLQEKFPANYERIVRTIKRIAPFFDDFVLRPNPLNEETIFLQWHDVNSIDTIFNASTLSDGTLRFICLVTLLLQPDEKLPSLILIDEPELGLHPAAIILLASLLRSAATKTQVIISTQSVPLINQFAPEDIVVVDKKERQSTFKRLQASDLTEWMVEYSGYGIGDLWEKNIIGGRPQVERFG